MALAVLQGGECYSCKWILRRKGSSLGNYLAMWHLMQRVIWIPQQYRELASAFINCG